MLHLNVKINAKHIAQKVFGAQNLEELVHMFGRRLVPYTGVGVPPHHVINGLHYRQHLLVNNNVLVSMIHSVTRLKQQHLRYYNIN